MDKGMLINGAVERLDTDLIRILMDRDKCPLSRLEAWRDGIGRGLRGIEAAQRLVQKGLGSLDLLGRYAVLDVDKCPSREVMVFAVRVGGVGNAKPRTVRLDLFEVLEALLCKDSGQLALSYVETQILKAL